MRRTSPLGLTPNHALIRFALLAGALASIPLAGPARAANSTTGHWIGPFSMGRLSTGEVAPVRATHLSVLRRQAAQGDTTLIVHWHDKDKLRVWRYTFTDASGLDTAHARLLSVPAQNEFCAGHVSLHDGRLLVAGGTDPSVSSEIGTTEVSTFDPNQVDLWTSINNWVVQDTMRYNRWYPALTHMADGSVVANSGLEYFEMPVIGGASPQDSSGPFRELRALGLSRYPTWPVEPINLDPLPATSFPQLQDHTAIVTANQQQRSDGRGVMETFGGITAGGTATSDTWQVWDVAVDAHNSWRSELMPLSAGSPLPPSRSQHAAGIVETATGLGSYELRMFVYGGLGASGTPLSDVWLLTRANNSAPATWQEITPSGPSPGPRYGHTSVFDPGVPPGGTVSFPPVGGLPRQYYPKLIVFGGKRSPLVWAGTDTVFVLQLWAPYAWHALVPTGQAPAPRYRHAAVMDRIKRVGQTRMRMSLFGGAGADGSPLNDTWTLSRSLADSLYSDWAWYQNPAGTVAPPVYKHSMVHDEQWNRLLVFGGDRSGEGPDRGDEHRGRDE